MSRNHKIRQKAIRDEKRRLGVKTIPADRFRAMRREWRAAIDGPPIGTLEDFMRAGDAIRESFGIEAASGRGK